MACMNILRILILKPRTPGDFLLKLNYGSDNEMGVKALYVKCYFCDLFTLSKDIEAK